MTSPDNRNKTARHSSGAIGSHAVTRSGVLGRYVAAVHARRPAPIVVTIIAALVVIGLIAWGVWAALVHFEDQRAAAEMRNTAVPTTVAENRKDKSQENAANIDWAKYRDRNPEVYAWLYVPGTGVNMPITQHVGDDSYYLDHNFWGEGSVLGAAYTEQANSQDFSDPVTVIYGHDVDSVFKNLHDFENRDFFARHDRIYVYTPNGKMRTYRVVSTYRTDDSHILNTNDLSSVSGRTAYFDKVMHPTDDIRFVREGATIKPDDKLLQLSTCMLNEWHGAHRYIVTGVLESEKDVIGK